MSDRNPPQKLNLPAGTQVVTLADARGPDGRNHPRGSVAVVLAESDDQASSRVRFLDGQEVEMRTSDLVIRKQFQLDALQRPEPLDLYEHVIFRVVVGSRAYGLDAEASDTDRRGIYLPPAELHWSLYGVPEQLERKESEECYWELEKFLLLALKANPNVLECLYSPLVETVTPLAEELLEMRSSFLSRLVYQTYSSYVMSQFKKLEHHLQVHGQVRWKHAMHLVRLLLSGKTVLREGFVPLRMDEHRERLLAIRHGLVPWNEVDAWRLELHRELDEDFARTTLPEWPDYEKANAFLIRARHSMVR